MRKKIIKGITTCFCVAAILVMNCVEVFAATNPFAVASGVNFNGQHDFKINAGKDNDLFSNMKNLMPGDEVSNTISIHNNGNKSISFYLKAKCDYDGSGDSAVNGDGNSVTVDGKVFHKDLLDMIDMTISADDVVLFRGSASGKAPDGQDSELVTASYGIKIGDVAAKASKQLTVTIKLPGAEMTNEYMNAFGAVDWMFIAEGTDSSGGGSDGGDSGGGDSGGNTPGGGTVIETIPEGPVPLSTLMPGDDPGDVNIYIDDSPIPLAGLAKTGGSVLYVKEIGILLISLLLGLAAVDRIRKRAIEKQ